MEHASTSIVFNELSKRWPEFEFKKSKKTWARRTEDDVLLMAQYQGSRWGGIYYLNFGAFYLGLQQIAKPLSNLPKSSDWHLFARYGAFEEMSAAEQNDLFSLENADAAIIKTKCITIASFCQEIIFPKLATLGKISDLKEKMKDGEENLFDPFYTQKIAKIDILRFLKLVPEINLG